MEKFNCSDLISKFFVILANAYMDVGGTIPWMESVESRLERRPRATQEPKPESNHIKSPHRGHFKY